MTSKTAKLSEVCEFVRNGMSIKQSKGAGGLPISRIETIWNASIDESRVGYAGLKIEDVRDYLLQQGDILLSHINSLEHIGKCAIYEGIPKQIVHGMNVLSLRPKKQVIEPKYLLYTLRTTRFRSQILSVTNKSVNQASVSTTNLKTLELPLPPLEQQRHIAAVLDAADTLRQKRRESLKKLDELLKSVFLDMFGDPVTNPRGWRIELLESLINPNRPITYGILKPGEDQVVGIPYVRVVDMSHHGDIKIDQLRKTSFDIDREYKRSKLKTEDLLISIRGHVGRLAIVPKQLDGANITQDTARLAISDISNPRFIKSVFETEGIKDVLRRHTKGAAVKGINLGDLRRFSIILPPLELQQKFSHFVQNLETERKRLESSLASLETLFASLQQQLFNANHTL